MTQNRLRNSAVARNKEERHRIWFPNAMAGRSYSRMWCYEEAQPQLTKLQLFFHDECLINSGGHNIININKLIYRLTCAYYLEVGFICFSNFEFLNILED
ncbi:hypothetical protein CEXT_204071 [Caerostris extrusa]|uniref:Uncharacterized protein n=1 Tax=Caerostris extrusa TaxID=172846 RepID=A0AAV4W636_CAEEX|nr:hypothetical protein CEXT_204071 [Caerostris extrusa]